MKINYYAFLMRSIACVMMLFCGISFTNAQTIEGEITPCPGTEIYRLDANNITDSSSVNWAITNGTSGIDWVLTTTPSNRTESTIQWINPGTYTINVSYDSEAPVTFSVTVVNTNAEMVDNDNIQSTTTIGCDTITFSIGSVANCRAGQTGLVAIEISDPSVVTLQYYENSASEWRTLVFNGTQALWGPPTGFPVQDIAGSPFRIVSNSATNVATPVTYNFVLVDAATQTETWSNAISGSFTVTSNNPQAELVDNDNIQSTTTIGCDTITFSIGSVANCRAGQTGLVAIEISDPSVVTLQYYENSASEWRTLVFNGTQALWGPPTGFPVQDIAGSPFRIVSNSATNVATPVTYNFVLVDAATQTETWSNAISGSFTVTSNNPQAELVDNDNIQSTTTIGCDTITFSIGSVANCRAGQTGLVAIEISDPSVVTLQYYENSASEWRTLVFNGTQALWGPPTGFPVQDIAGSPFRIVSNSATNVATPVTYNFVLVDAATQTETWSNAISGSFTVTSNNPQAELVDNDNIQSTTTIGCDTITFSIGSVANCRAGQTGLVAIEISDPSVVTLQYYENSASEWRTLVFNGTRSLWGPPTGFPVSDIAGSPFRIVSNSATNVATPVTYNFVLVDAATQTETWSNAISGSFTVTSNNPQAELVDNDNIQSTTTIGCDTITFSIGSVANCRAGQTGLVAIEISDPSVVTLQYYENSASEWRTLVFNGTRSLWGPPTGFPVSDIAGSPFRIVSNSATNVATPVTYSFVLVDAATQTETWSNAISGSFTVTSNNPQAELVDNDNIQSTTTIGCDTITFSIGSVANCRAGQTGLVAIEISDPSVVTLQYYENSASEWRTLVFNGTQALWGPPTGFPVQDIAGSPFRIVSNSATNVATPVTYNFVLVDAATQTETWSNAISGSFTVTSNNPQAELVDNDNIQSTTTIGCDTITFSIGSVANCRAGQTGLVAIEISDPSVVTLQYFENTASEWRSLVFNGTRSLWGPPTGFPVSDIAGSPFRIVSNSATNVATPVTYSFVLVDAATQTETWSNAISGSFTVTSNNPQAELTDNDSIQNATTIGCDTVAFSIGSIANCRAGQMGLVAIEISDPSVVTLQYFENTASEWRSLVFNGTRSLWGPPTGFPVSDIAGSPFRIVSNSATNVATPVTYSFVLVDAATQTETWSNAISGSFTVTSNNPQAELTDNDSIQNATTIGCDTVAFSIGSIANCRAGQMGLVAIEISDPSVVTLQYFENTASEWRSLVFNGTRSLWGPPTGFPVSDIAGSPFRIVSNSATNVATPVTYSFVLVDAATQTEVWSNAISGSFTVTSNNPQAELTDNDSIQNATTIGCDTVTFSIGSIANCRAGQTGLILIEIDEPSTVTLEYYENMDSQWHELTFNGTQVLWGPPSGFPVQDIAGSPFRIVSNSDTTVVDPVNYRFVLVDAATKTEEWSNAISGSFIVTSNTGQAVLIDNDSVQNLTKITCDTVTFSIGSAANCKAGELGLILIEIDNPSAVILQYYENTASEWRTLVFNGTRSLWGPPGGFPVSNIAGSPFRIMSNTPATDTASVNYRFVLVDAATQTEEWSNAISGTLTVDPLPYISVSASNTAFCGNEEILIMVSRTDDCFVDGDAWSYQYQIGSTSVLTRNPNTLTDTIAVGTIAFSGSTVISFFDVNDAGTINEDTVRITLLDMRTDTSAHITIDCPDFLITTIPPGECDITTLDLMPEIRHWLDSVDGANPEIEVRLLNSSEILTAGAHNVTWIATDRCDLSDTCSTVVYVNMYPCGTSQIYANVNDTVQIIDTTLVAVDFEGNEYATVRLGCECWTAENLRSTIDRLGNPVNSYVYYADMYPDTVQNEEIFGRLYDYESAVNSGVTRAQPERIPGICPDGWALPDRNDYATIAQYGSSALRSVSYWIDGGNTNATGFNALPAGYYNGNSNSFYHLMGETYFWIGEETPGNTAPAFSLMFGCADALFTTMQKNFGLSVRCIKVQ